MTGSNSDQIGGILGQNPAIDFIRALGLDEKQVAADPLSVEFVAGGNRVLVKWTGMMSLTPDQLSDALQGIPVERGK